MGLRRYANRRDQSEPAIVAALEALGCLVERMDKPADLLVRLPAGKGIALVECKTGRGKLTKDQVTFHEQWPVNILRTVDDAISFVQGARRAA